MSNKQSNIILAMLLVMVTLVVGAFLAIAAVFRRNESIISEKGDKILSDEGDRNKLLDALNDGKQDVVSTSQGEVYIQ